MNYIFDDIDGARQCIIEGLRVARNPPTPSTSTSASASFCSPSFSSFFFLLRLLFFLLPPPKNPVRFCCFRFSFIFFTEFFLLPGFVCQKKNESFLLLKGGGAWKRRPRPFLIATPNQNKTKKNTTKNRRNLIGRWMNGFFKRFFLSLKPEDNLRQLHGIQESIQRMRQVSVQTLRLQVRRSTELYWVLSRFQLVGPSFNLT